MPEADVMKVLKQRFSPHAIDEDITDITVCQSAGSRSKVPG